eukprot:1159957-Pelagomonas_calceolata.AAC.16
MICLAYLRDGVQGLQEFSLLRLKEGLAIGVPVLQTKCQSTHTNAGLRTKGFLHTGRPKRPEHEPFCWHFAKGFSACCSGKHSFSEQCT